MSDIALDLDSRVAQLEREVRRLSDEVVVLRTLVDPDDIRAAAEMRRNPVTNEPLRAWSERSVIPDKLADLPEEKPW
jgi:hypothetical protein